MTPQPRYQPGDRIGGRYQVHKALMGGMGEVYLCLDLEENYPFALKTFQQRYLTDTQRLRKAFEQEVATWVALEKHPNIVRCFIMKQLDYQPFMVLEWVAGEEGRGTDLRGWLRRGPLGLKLALEVAIDICRGLIYAQTKQPGLVHRDLKPENILMAQGGLAKITDFGLAQIVLQAKLEVEHELNATDSRRSFVGGRGIAGTPAYMAPEQWRGESLDERTDIYALGCILYELLTGVCPFQVAPTSTAPQNSQAWLRTMQVTHERALIPALPAVLPVALNDLVQRCLAKTPTKRYANLSNVLTSLADIYEVHFDQSPPPRPAPGVFTANEYNNRGVTYHALRSYQAALDDFGHAITLDPNFALTYVNRGVTYIDLQRYEAAFADFNHAIDLNLKDVSVYINRGNLYKDLKDYPAALADYNQAIALDPNDAIVYSNRGMIYHDLQQYETALADYNQAIAIDVNLAEAYNNRGITYHAVQNYQKALTDYYRAVELDPHYVQAYGNRGVTYAALQNYPAAQADFNHALALDPNRAKVYVWRGNTHEALQNYPAALADFSHAIELDPNDAIAHNNRGNVQRALQNYQAALEDYRRTIELDPNYVKAFISRGNIYRTLQQDHASIEDYRHAIELDPNDAQAYLNLGALMGSRRRFQEALPYFEEAAQLGEPQGTQYAAQARRILGIEPEPPSDPAQAAFTAFRQADSLPTMQQAAARFPVLTQPNFIAAIEQAIAQQVPPADRPAFTQRLAWLRQIASTQRSTQ